MNTRMETIYEQEYKALSQKYDKLAAEHLMLLQQHEKLKTNFHYLSHKSVKTYPQRKLHAEIKSLHRKLRDANRGAERNAWIAHDLARELTKHRYTEAIKMHSGKADIGQLSKIILEEHKDK